MSIKISKNASKIFYIISTAFILWIILILIWRPNKIHGRIFSIERNGFCVIPSVFSKKECETIEKLANKNKIRELMRDFFNENYSIIYKIREKIAEVSDTQSKFCGGDGGDVAATGSAATAAGSQYYTFHNYLWNIRKGSVVTCHSDNNARRFNPKQKYPSYTVLVYPTGGCLGVIPKSHKKEYRKWFYWYNPIVDIVCDPGDIILFDAELVHVGGTSCSSRENPRIQLKVSHKDDMKVLDYYQNYYKIIDKKVKIPEIISNAQKNLVCMFPIISDMTQNENIRTARGSVEGVKIGWGQKLFSLLFYGDANYYDLTSISTTQT